MKHIIAATLGLDLSELEDYRYQPTRTTRRIYSIDDFYVATGLTAPKDHVGGPWEKHPDQFWAHRGKKKTTIWVARAI